MYPLEFTMPLLQANDQRKIKWLFSPDVFMVWLLMLVGHAMVALCDKYLPEFNDKQAFEISWLSSDPVVGNDANLSHLINMKIFK